MRGIVARARGRKQEQRHVTSRGLRVNSTGHGQCILVRQFEIEDDSIEEITLCESCERIAAVRGGFHGHAPLLAALRNDAPIRGTVLDDQQALAGELWLWALPGRGRSGGSRAGQDGEMEGGAFAGTALDPDL